MFEKLFRRKAPAAAEGSAANHFLANKERLQSILEAEFPRMQEAMNSASDSGDTEVLLSRAVHAETQEAIEAIFARKETYLISHLREWLGTKLRCSIEQRGSEIVLVWSNIQQQFPKGLADRGDPLYGDEV